MMKVSAIELRNRLEYERMRMTYEPRSTSDPVTATPLITLRGITKAFPNVVANDQVDLDIHEVHALLGEKGAGTSTLVKADSGEMRFRGQRKQMRSPLDARNLGIGMVFQDFTLIPAIRFLEHGWHP
jgi:ABC-type uncharacterized transport system ATPase subunit